MSDKWWQDELGVLTKKALAAQIREIVDRTNCRVNTNDALFMLQIFKHHYEWEEKRGVGVSHLEVRSNGPTRGFWIVRTDGTHIDISWVVALKVGGAPTDKENAAAATRFEIRDQIAACQHSYVCELCGLPIRGYDATHVDHVVPFDSLLSDFLTLLGLTYADIKTHSIGTRRVMSDTNQRQWWRAYHQKMAILRMTHDTCNLSRERA
jgi:hypothetical protein